jgi:3-oxoacyl-[acyl-carrier protein] reductase
MLLKGKTAIVTGCNRGIGKGILDLFAEHGADLFACARRETPEFSAHLAELAERTGRSIAPVYFDLTDIEQVKDAVQTIMAAKRPIDVLVNNAGVASGAFFQMSSLPEMRNLFEINFFSQLLFSQGISRLMARAKKGSIVNIASTAGLIGDAGMTSYGASKAALMFATKTIATELGASNIRVNAVAPSVTRTDMYEQMEDKARTKLIEACALKRPAEVREVANAALFLASDMASYITGQVLRVDGGHTT